MKMIFDYMLLFAFGSIGGWIIELFFRRFFSMKRWINPGFLNGPCLPLYGFGLTFLYIICNVNYEFITSDIILQNVITICICGIVMTIIEYVAGIIFIKQMKIRLWDYSNQWGNIQGIICPLFSVFWLLIGTAYYYLLNPFFTGFLNNFNSQTNLLFLLGFFYGILTIDLWMSFNVTKRIKEYAVEHKVIVSYELLKNHFFSIKNSLKEKSAFIFPFNPRKISFKDVLASYKEKISNLKFVNKNDNNNDQNK